MAVYAGPEIVTNGLVLALDAGNTQSYPGSGTAWTDLSRNGNNGTLTNGPTYSSNNRGYISFDGTNDFVSLSPVPAIDGGSATVSLWNYGIQSKTSSAFWFEGSTGRQFQVHLPWSDNVVYFDVGQQVGGFFDRINKTATNAEYQGWHHWTFIKDTSANAMYIYLDGSLWHSGVGATQPINTITSAYIAYAVTGGHYHNAYIANFLVYKKALSASEVAQNFNALRGRFGI